MKVLVTGGAGFIASHVVDQYLLHGYEVAIVDNLSTGRSSNLNPKAKFYHMDIGSPELKDVFEAERPDFVNHHAAQIDVRKSVVDPIFDATVNIIGSLKVIELAKTYDVKKFVYISTGGAVYGEPEYLPCDEAHPVNPICQYGASKHTVEHYLYMYHFNYGLNYAVLRYPNVYGPRQDPHGEAGVVAIFTGQMLNQESVRINGDGEQSRDFVYVLDCARANVMVTEQENSHGIYNIGSEIGASVNDVYGHLKKITAYPHEVQYGPAKVGETRHIYLTAQRAGRELGWEPTVDLGEGLRRTVQYFRDEDTP